MGGFLVEWGNMIKDGKTNWKFLLIVVVLATIVGGGILWFEVKQKTQFTQLLEIEIPGKLSPEQCKNIKDSDWRDECWIHLAEKQKNISFCEKVELEISRDTCEQDVDEILRPYYEKEAKKIIENRAAEIILAIKNKDMKKLSTFVHPEKGVRFSPYSFDLNQDNIVFSPTQVLNFFQDRTIYTWGSYDYSALPINLIPERIL